MELEQLVAQERVRDVEEGRGPVAPGRGSQAAADRGEQGLTDAQDRADAGGDAALAVEVVRVGEPLQADADRGRERSWVVDQVAGRAAERERRGRPFRDELAGALRDRGDRGRGLRHRGGHPTSTSSGRPVVAAAPPWMLSGSSRKAYRSFSSCLRASGAPK